MLTRNIRINFVDKNLTLHITLSSTSTKTTWFVLAGLPVHRIKKNIRKTKCVSEFTVNFF